MRQTLSIISTAASLAALLGSLALAPAIAVAADEAKPSVIDEGKKIAFDRKKGNCLACDLFECLQALSLRQMQRPQQQACVTGL